MKGISKVDTAEYQEEKGRGTSQSQDPEVEHRARVGCLSHSKAGVTGGE